MPTETLISPSPLALEPPPPASQEDLLALQRIKNEIAKRLLQSWLAEDPAYDTKAWAIVKPLIEENRLSARRRFDE
ncbi:hypothetical protein HUU05_25515 [candidate division KSB1 bacterium]|nr:hypothetical protein [candidate division KSB1 bacterium]